MPARLSPQLAMPATSLPHGDGWIVEAKYDGYRVLTKIQRGKVTLLTRTGEDWTKQFGSLVPEIAKLGISEAWLDGEMVALRDGLPDFGALQEAIGGRHDDVIAYVVFDVPYLEGRDLRHVPLKERRAQLARLLEGRSDRVRFSESFDAPVDRAFQAACEIGLEGLMLKRADSPYTSTRSADWLKAKCRLRQEFVVCGFIDREGTTAEVGSLLLGVQDRNGLRFAGGVGTGWSSETARALRRNLSGLRTRSLPFDAETMKLRPWARGRARTVHWVKPTLVVEVEFAAWTTDGRVRQASFKGIRHEKPATEVRREAVKVDVGAPRRHARITHPERVIDAASGITKLDLVRYYESVADWMLPHLAARPVALLRAPDGIAGKTFFQKHGELTALPGLTVHPASLWRGHESLVTVDSADALLAAAQLNVVEFHTWNSTIATLQHPDRIVFDLDPGEGAPWQHVQEAAQLVRGLLDELGLQAWVKTSGGKGLHVVVPLSPELGYHTVKGFSQAVVRHMAKTLPQRFVAKAGAGNRKGKVFVDYLRNGIGQTTVAAFSARARPGMGVSMPISWEQLPELGSSAQWNVRNAREYLSFQLEDPWRDYWHMAQELAEAIERLG